jgi:hypothetical protein
MDPHTCNLIWHRSIRLSIALGHVPNSSDLYHESRYWMPEKYVKERRCFVQNPSLMPKKWKEYLIISG